MYYYWMCLKAPLLIDCMITRRIGSRNTFVGMSIGSYITNATSGFSRSIMTYLYTKPYCLLTVARSRHYSSNYSKDWVIRSDSGAALSLYIAMFVRITTAAGLYISSFLIRNASYPFTAMMACGEKSSYSSRTRTNLRASTAWESMSSVRAWYLFESRVAKYD